MLHKGARTFDEYHSQTDETWQKFCWRMCVGTMDGIIQQRHIIFSATAVALRLVCIITLDAMTYMSHVPLIFNIPIQLNHFIRDMLWGAILVFYMRCFL
uniref:Uncharacterized protein n=1 Tax=Rhipicephalus zambeziensis TaxID=60191 RepID=A0A224YGR0_9ACAR